MDYEESVGKDEVPDGARRIRNSGIWQNLLNRALADYNQGKVTVVILKNKTEYRQLRNGMQLPLRNAGYRMDPKIFDLPDGKMRIYLELEPRAPDRNNSHPRKPARSGVRPRRKT